MFILINFMSEREKGRERERERWGGREEGREKEREDNSDSSLCWMNAGYQTISTIDLHYTVETIKLKIN